MPSIPQTDWWINIPHLTSTMDFTLDYFCALKKNPNLKKQFNKELNDFCDFLSEHPIAKQHNKKAGDIMQHMKMNIRRVNQGLPVHH